METKDDITVDTAVDTAVEDVPSEGGAPAGAGATLRAAREARRLSLEHVAAETRIPIRHLETIEAGDFDLLPSRTYAIGFARNYARAVGLEEAGIVDLVREDMGSVGPRSTSLRGEMEPGDPAKLPSAGLAWFAGIAALILAFGVITFASTYYGAGEGPASLLADAQPNADEGGAGEGAIAQADPEGEAAMGASASAAPSADGKVVFTALEDGIWVRFYEDGGERLFEAQMESGDTFELPANASEPRINTGRPDALSITIGGRAVPKLSEEPVTMGDTPISAAALLARPRT
ncbi:MAG: RodZ domain-containing protein [Pseudomonadota bacterium]